MKKTFLTVCMSSTFLLFTACGGDDGGSVSYVTDDKDNNIPLNTIQNPVVKATAYSKDDAVLAPVSADRTVLDYKMLGTDGTENIATALVLTPKTAPPKAGWPIVVWAHGTTGVADTCAPTQRGLSGTEYLIAQLVDAGYVVVAPDYEGLGSAGNHPFLNLKSEAYSITDSVVAARDYLSKQGKLVSKQWLTIGHSQGGQAALGAAEYASRAQLEYKGTIAIAPVSYLKDILTLGEESVKNQTTAIQIPVYAQLDTFSSLVIAGMQGHKVSVNYDQIFKSNLAAVAPKAEVECYDVLGQEIGKSMLTYVANPNNAWENYGRLQPNYQQVPVIKNFLEKDSQPLKVKVSTPIIIYQGSADTTVPKLATDQLVLNSSQLGTQIDYRTDKDASALWTHGTVYSDNFSKFVTDVKTLMPIQ